MEANNQKMREVLEVVKDAITSGLLGTVGNYPNEGIRSKVEDIIDKIDAALAAAPHTGKWKNGRKYEYEYAYCSACGRMQWAGWDSHNQAEENIEDFANDYRFCPGCGAKMEGGVYVK